MERKAQNGERKHREFRWILRSEDAGWLFDRLNELEKIEQDVWEDLLFIARDPRAGRKKRLEIRQYVKEHRPEIVANYTRSLRRQRKWEKDRAAKLEAPLHNEQKKQEVQIVERSIEATLSWTRADIKAQMHQLSWICFGGDHGRPSNLIGTWTDLESDAQAKVLALCERALRECEPTPIPVGNSFPGAVLYEAWCFRWLAAEQSHVLALDSDMIRKWLPSLFYLDL